MDLLATSIGPKAGPCPACYTLIRTVGSFRPKNLARDRFKTSGRCASIVSLVGKEASRTLSELSREVLIATRPLSYPAAPTADDKSICMK